MSIKSDSILNRYSYVLAIFFIAAVFGIAACAPMQKQIAHIEAHQQLEKNRKNMGQGFFDEVIFENEKVLQTNDMNAAAEVALYALGEVYAHHDFEGRNYTVSQSYFERLIKNFPLSPLTSEAKVYISLFEAIASSEKAVAEKELSLQKAVLSAHEKKLAKVPPPRKTLVKNKNFEEAEANNMKILSRSAGKKPADKAMYNLGLIYVHVDNPQKNYTKAQAYFHLLTEKFPKSEYTEEARIWLGLLETIDQLLQIDIDLEQQKRKVLRQ